MSGARDAEPSLRGGMGILRRSAYRPDRKNDRMRISGCRRMQTDRVPIGLRHSCTLRRRCKLKEKSGRQMACRLLGGRDGSAATFRMPYFPFDLILHQILLRCNRKLRRVFAGLALYFAQPQHPDMGIEAHCRLPWRFECDGLPPRPMNGLSIGALLADTRCFKARWSLDGSIHAGHVRGQTPAHGHRFSSTALQAMALPASRQIPSAHFQFFRGTRP